MLENAFIHVASELSVVRAPWLTPAEIFGVILGTQPAFFDSAR